MFLYVGLCNSKNYRSFVLTKLNQLRAILESSAAALAADPEVDISEIESVYEEAEEALNAGDFKQYTDLNRAFHSEIWTAAGNQKMKNMISELWNGLSMGSMVSEDDYAKVSIKEQGNILKAIQVHDLESFIVLTITIYTICYNFTVSYLYIPIIMYPKSTDL